MAFAGIGIGLLYAVGVDDPGRSPWAFVAVVIGVAGAEAIGRSLLSWQPEEDEAADATEAARASFAIRAVLVCLGALVAALVLYGVSDSPVAAWVAAGSLLALLLSGFTARWFAR